MKHNRPRDVRERKDSGEQPTLSRTGDG